VLDETKTITGVIDETKTAMKVTTRVIEEREWLNPNEKEFKAYAPGIGLIQEEVLLLTSSRRDKPILANQGCRQMSWRA